MVRPLTFRYTRRLRRRHDGTLIVPSHASTIKALIALSAQNPEIDIALVDNNDNIQSSQAGMVIINDGRLKEVPVDYFNC